MTKPPVVFLGPSLSRVEAQAILPDADFRPPAQRGDLYRARFLGASVIVFIDGVFLERYAPSPREVVEVLRDGACVIGAGSLGALRAAECWPVGMMGAGLIYRLFRAGHLHSDEEVALIYDAKGHRPLSVPLVNVRYAAHRATKAGLLTDGQREAVVRAATEIFYDERTWPGIFSALDFAVDDACKNFLNSVDLKKCDAVRALKSVARRLEREPRLHELHTRRSQAPFTLTENSREPAADPVAGVPHAQVRRELARWLLASGRFRRHLAGLVAIPVAAPAGMPGSDEEALRADLRRVIDTRSQRRASLAALLADFDEFAARLWVELTLSGERDAELFRWVAARQLAEEAESGRPADLASAERDMLAEHGIDS